MAERAPRPLSVALDVTPLLGARTGIGLVVESVVSGMTADPRVDPTGMLIGWRGRDQLTGVLPAGWSPKRIGLPARACHQLWRRIDSPALSGFDVVHGLNYVVPPSGGGAELVAVHDLTSWRFPELVNKHSKHNPALLRRALARGAHVHTGSRFVADEIVSELGAPPERVHAIANGLPPNRPGDATRGRRLIGGDYVLAVGTIEPRKDYVGLVGAMNDVWSVNVEISLVIVGQTGWGAEAVGDAIARCRFPNKVFRPGYVTEQDKADLLAGASVLAYPSLYEGFGFPLLEAMAADVPVVATNAGSIPEVAGDAAVLVAPGDRAVLAKAIVSVLDDDDLATDLVDRGRRQLARYSWPEMVDQLVGLYGRLAG